MKKTVNKKVIAVVLSAVCAFSALTAISAVAVSAASNTASASQSSSSAVIVEKTSGNTFTLPMKGYDWNYYADSLNVKVTCDFDYNNNICRFRFTAVKPGVTNVTLKTQEENGMWAQTPVRITVDNNLRMSIVQTGNATLTEKSSTETTRTDTTSQTEETKKSEEKKSSETQNGTYRYSIQGSDWTYYADSLNIKITCDFDYYNNICHFVFTAVKPGTTNAVLKTERDDGKWNNTPVRITADSNMNITVTQSGAVYVTNTSSSK